MRAYLAEGIGTFFLVFTIGLSVAFAGAMAPLAIGLGLSALVYAGYGASGAQYNPAVTIGVYMVGAISARKAILFIAIQLVSSLAASMVVFWLSGHPMQVAPGAGFSALQVLVAEVLGTFVLMYVILEVAVRPEVKGNHYYGLAIGLTVTAMAYALGPLSGAALNPAVGIGPNLVLATNTGGEGLGHLWIYTGGPVLGAALAAFLYKATA